MRQKPRRDVEIVLQQVSLGQMQFRPENFLQICEVDHAARDAKVRFSRAERDFESHPRRLPASCAQALQTRTRAPGFGSHCHPPLSF